MTLNTPKIHQTLEALIITINSITRLYYDLGKAAYLYV